MAKDYVEGLDYFWGEGGKRQDLKMAAVLFEQAANRNLPAGMFMVALCHHDGMGVQWSTSNRAKAVKWFHEAAGRGSDLAKLFVPSCLMTSPEPSLNLVPNISLQLVTMNLPIGDPTQAAGPHPEEGNGRNHGQSQGEMGGNPNPLDEVQSLMEDAVHEENLDLDPDIEESFFLKNEALLRRGDPLELFVLGNCFEFGVMKPKSLRLAASCYATSAEKGYWGALRKLGHFHFGGKGGIKHDSSAGLQCWLRAAEMGFALSQFDLSKLYRTGGGFMEPDEEESKKWALKAVRQGLKVAEDFL